MKRILILLAVFILAVIAVFSVRGLATEVDGKQKMERIAWVAKCLSDFRQIKPGMTRAEIEKRMHIDGGFQGYVTVRYFHPECSYFKIDVDFSVKQDQGKQGQIVSSADDKAMKVSKPYIENPQFD